MMQAAGWRPLTTKIRNLSSIWNIVCRNLSIVRGKGKPDSTKNFIASSSLPFHHRFNATNLYINPIIHGPPSFWNAEEDCEYGTSLFKAALLNNRSNCHFVYKHELNATETYCMPDLYSILNDQPTITREQLVLGANLGRPILDPNVLLARLQTACKETKIENLDFVVVEVDDRLLTHHPVYLDLALRMLESMCKSGVIQFYGVQLTLEPYNFHSVPKRSMGDFMMYPMSFEALVTNSLKKCDLVIYPISPSITYPTTFPLMEGQVSAEELADDDDDDDDDVDKVPDVNVFNEKDFESDEDDEDEDNEDSKAVSKPRLFTRAAKDPLWCFPGVNQMSLEERQKWALESHSAKLEGMVSIEEAGLKLVSGLYENETEKGLRDALDSLCPPLESTPNLQDKALRVVLSTEVETVIMDADLAPLIGKLNITPAHFLHSNTTRHVFGKFVLPNAMMV